jgi:hypothetical protein
VSSVTVRPEMLAASTGAGTLGIVLVTLLTWVVLLVRRRLTSTSKCVPVRRTSSHDDVTTRAADRISAGPSSVGRRRRPAQPPAETGAADQKNRHRMPSSSALVAPTPVGPPGMVAPASTVASPWHRACERDTARAACLGLVNRTLLVHARTPVHPESHVSPCDMTPARWGYPRIEQPGEAHVFLLLPYPQIVWGANEFVRDLLRRRHPVSPGEFPSGLGGPLVTAATTWFAQLGAELRAIASF